MGKSKGKSQTRTMPDPFSQHYINQMRGVARGANVPNDLVVGELTDQDIMSAMNPYQSQVIDRQMADWGQMADMGMNQIGQQAAGRRSFGSRRDVAEGQMLGDISRNKMNQLAQLRHGGYQNAIQLAEHRRQLAERELQEPVMRADMKLRLMNLGLGPVGTWSSSESEGGKNLFGQLLGLGGLLAGSGVFGGGGNQPTTQFQGSTYNPYQYG